MFFHILVFCGATAFCIYEVVSLIRVVRSRKNNSNKGGDNS